MWCPKCKNEYKPGITVCADCQTPLVDELPTAKSSDSIFDLQYENKAVSDDTAASDPPDEQLDANAETADNSGDAADRPVACASKEVSHSYETMRSRYENHHSSAIILLALGTVGAIAILLHILGIIDFRLVGFSKVMVNVVMGGLFVIFIIFGISSAKSASQYKKQADEEDALTEKILGDFRTLLTTSIIDSAVNITENSTEQTYDIWRKRYSYIFYSIRNNYPQLSNDYTEYVTELLYNELYGVDEITLS